LTLLVWCQEGHPACKKTEWWGAVMVICLERGADLHMAQLIPLPLTVSCFSKIQIGFTFLVPAHPGSPRQRAVKCVYVNSVLLMSAVKLYFWVVAVYTTDFSPGFCVCPQHIWSDSKFKCRRWSLWSVWAAFIYTIQQRLQTIWVCWLFSARLRSSSFLRAVSVWTASIWSA